MIDFSKVKNFLSLKTLIKKWRENLQSGKKYLQNTFLRKDLLKTVSNVKKRTYSKISKRSKKTSWPEKLHGWQAQETWLTAVHWGQAVFSQLVWDHYYHLWYSSITKAFMFYTFTLQINTFGDITHKYTGLYISILEYYITSL